MFSYCKSKGMDWGTIDTLPEITRPTQLPADGPLLFTGSFFTAWIGETLFQAS